MEGTDPIADMLTRIRNALMVQHEAVLVPASGIKIGVARILRQEGFIQDYQILKGNPQRSIKITLKYGDKKKPAISGLVRVSKPGLRVYVSRQEVPRVYGGLGTAILTTPQGVVTGHEAWRRHLGGEVLCYVW